jgi:hypothetical protein
VFIRHGTAPFAVALPVSSLTHYEVINKTPISDSIKRLGVISCDICKTARASHDVFVKGIEGVAFLKRCCERCVKNLT